MYRRPNDLPPNDPLKLTRRARTWVESARPAGVP